MSTGYEGGMRTPAMIRWPGKIQKGVVTDEIIADLDWYPTLAHLIGEEERIPTDRPIDGINQEYTFPQVFDIKEDVKESFELWGNEGYVHAWVMGPVMKILNDNANSMQQYPNITPGADFQGY